MSDEMVDEQVTTTEEISDVKEDVVSAPVEEGSADAISALKGMFSFFTILPINIDQKEMDSMNKEFWLVPVVGLFYGLLAMVVFELVSNISTYVLACALSIFSVEFVNRFLHFDGMIDVGDGLMVAGRREDHTRALKDTLVGAGGVATAAMFILIIFSELLSLNANSIAMALVAAEVLARFAQVVTAGFGSPSNGMAGASVRNTDKTSILMAAVLTVILLAIGCVIATFVTHLDIGAFCRASCYFGAAISMAVAFLWGYVMSKVAMKNFGFVNGDVLGATNQTTRIVVLLVMILITVNFW